MDIIGYTNQFSSPAQKARIHKWLGSPKSGELVRSARVRIGKSQDNKYYDPTTVNGRINSRDFVKRLNSMKDMIHEAKKNAVYVGAFEKGKTHVKL